MNLFKITVFNFGVFEVLELRYPNVNAAETRQANPRSDVSPP